MKKTKVLFFLLSTLLLASCKFELKDTNSDSATGSSDISSDPSSDFTSSDDKVIVDYDRTANFYAINDFHGAVIPNGYEAGIVRVGGFLKDKNEEDNTIVINSGDMWQGSIESNYNFGKLLTDCMNYIEFDCFTLGNHEFDWGTSYIEENRLRKGKNGDDENGYQTPFLAANIYNYDIETKKVGDYANLGEPYTISTLENGLKVGIIGVIGSDQITSITSQFVDHLTFKDPTPIIKELSDELRTQKGVDIVILDTHTGQDDVDNTVTSISSISNKRYVDAVFCAHTHRNESKSVNGVPFIQAAYNGRAIANVSLNVTPEGNVTCTSYSTFYTSSIASEYDDSELQTIVDKYKTKSDEAAKENLAILSGSLNKYDTLVNFVCTAMADYASDNNINIDYAIANSGRDNLSSGRVTYGQLYKSLPFDNEIYVIKATGRSIANELNYDSNSMYRVTTEALSRNKVYTIAVLDYLALHRNSNREYNYFPGMTIVSKFEKAGYAMYNYRDITADYMKSFSGSIDVSLYTDSNPRHDTSKLFDNVTF